MGVLIFGSAHKDTKRQRNQRLQSAQGTENNAIVGTNSDLNIGKHGRILWGA